MFTIERAFEIAQDFLGDDSLAGIDHVAVGLFGPNAYQVELYTDYRAIKHRDGKSQTTDVPRHVIRSERGLLDFWDSLVEESMDH